MKTIYILLTRSGTLLSKLVYAATGASYTHASMAFDAELSCLYSSTRKNGYTMFPAGPSKEYLNKGVFRLRDDAPCALYALEVSDEAYSHALHRAEDFMRHGAQQMSGNTFPQMGGMYGKRVHHQNLRRGNPLLPGNVPVALRLYPVEDASSQQRFPIGTDIELPVGQRLLCRPTRRIFPARPAGIVERCVQIVADRVVQFHNPIQIPLGRFTDLHLSSHAVPPSGPRVPSAPFRGG